MNLVKMMDLQWTSMFSSVSAIWKRSLLCLALMLALYPLLSQQELTAHPITSSRETSKIRKASAMFPHGGSVSGSSHPQMSAMTNGNVTLESISERLARMDDSLAGLIQGVLTVQRTVFNLEQLQELLVLLLEDILKQTGKVDKIPTRDTNPTFGGGTSGGSSLPTDSDDTDSGDVTSTENDDGTENDRVTANPEENAGMDKVNGRGNEPAIRTNLVSGPFGTRNEQFGMSALNQNNNGFTPRQSTDPYKTGRREDSTGDSSEGGRSSSNEDYTGGFMRVMQRKTQPANIPVPNLQRPEWSEPIMEHGKSDPSRFFDVIHRMVSQLSQSAARTSPRLLGLMHGDSTPHQKLSESMMEHPPMYEPLEIVSAQDTTFINEKKPAPRMMPIKVKLLPESVVSHGGPLTGPEHYSSLYLEHLEEHPGVESTGETSDGMISNLVQPYSNHISANDSEIDTSQEDYRGHIQVEKPVTDIRRKREAFNKVSLNKDTKADAGNREILNSTRRNESQQGNISFIVKEATLSRHEEGSTNANNLTKNGSNSELQNQADKEYDLNANSSQGITQETIEQTIKIGGPEYDGLIAKLLTDLSTQLHNMHTESIIGSEDVFSQALHELDKLIWVSTESASNSPVTFELTNTSAADEDTETNDDDQTMAAREDNVPHTFAVERHNLNQDASEQSVHSNESSSLSTMKVTEITNTGNKISDKYSMSPPEGNVHREMFISEQEQIRHLNRQEVSTTATGTSKSDLENVTSSSEDFDWLYKLLGNSDIITADVKSLVHALNSLSLNGSFSDELRELNSRARSVLTTTVYTSHLEKNVNLNTHMGVADNDTESDDDHINDDSTLKSQTEDSSRSEDGEEDNKEDMLARKMGVRDDVFKMLEKDHHFGNVHHNDNINFNHDQGVHGDQKEDNKSKRRKQNDDDDDDDDNSSYTDEISEYIPDKSRDHGDTDAWLLKTAPLLDPRTQTKAQSSLLSSRPNGSLHPDGAVNNIDNKLIYRNPRATENKRHHTNTAVNTEIQREQIHSVIGRQKRHANLLQRTKSISNLSPRDVPNQQKTLPQTQLSNGNTDAAISQISFSKSRNENTNNPEISFQNPSQSSPNVEVRKDNISQQNDMKFAPNGSHITESNQLNSQGYGKSTSDLHSINSHVNSYSQSYNTPDQESLRGTSSPEETEIPSVEEPSALDLEEILTSLFLTYWQRFYHLYTRATPLTTTPADLEVEEEITEAILTTEASPAVTNVTADSNTYLTSTASKDTALGKGDANTTSTAAVVG